jgi:DNA-binding NarL/FixJ family response regulator
MRILVADEQDLFRAGLLHVVGEVVDDPQIYEAVSYQEVLARARNNAPFDLILLGLAMPDGTMFGAYRSVAALVEICPEAAIVVLSVSEDPSDVDRALAQGARGYVLKSARADVLHHVLSLVLAGEIYVPPIVMAQRFGQTHRLSEARWLGEPRAESAALGKLTPRERQVLAHLIDGLSNKAIAQALSIGEGTVKVHLKAVLRKLDVANRTQAATLALKLGWSRAGAASP